ncbi:MAG: protein kinase domain-containing protein, partial [Planctomycetota bacterium]
MKIVCGKCNAEVELPSEGDKIECPSCGALFRIPSLEDGGELPRPDTFPGYRIKAIIGHGGMGTVFRATQLSMDREVAIKVLLRKYSTVPRFVNRFDREATALAKLNHPNIVAVIDRGHADDLYYLVMEYVHGRTLRYYIKNELLTVERCAAIAIEVCRALEAAHDDGIVHRDIKPGNILVQEDGPVKVADFGIVHMVEQQDQSETERRSRLGTARYMAPEQRGTGEVIDPRADIYALGVTLHEMLTGSLPTGEPPSAHNPRVPPALDSIVQQALQDQRDQRFQSAADLRQALEVLAESMQLEKTPATIELAGGPTVPCPACQGQVPAGRDVCPHCEAALAEACYRDGCEGVNPVGAERCRRCGGHLELLKRQRRAELEALVRQAEARAEAGDVGQALDLYAEVLDDPHADFAPLRQRATDASRALRRERALGLLRSLAAAAAAFLIVLGAGVGTYWGVTRLLATASQPEPSPPQEPPPDTTDDPRPDTATPDTAAPAPQPPRPRPALFREYLVAITGEGWAEHSAAARLAAACDAAVHLALGRRDDEAAERVG